MSASPEPPRASGMVAQIPNLLTLARIAAIPILVALIAWGTPHARLLAVALFVLASVTDFFDGWLARRLNVQSRFGKMLDPIADKLIVAAALIMLVANGAIAGAHLIAVLLILGREIFVSGLREFLALERVTVPVTGLAKWKTTAQLAAITALLLWAAPDAHGAGPTTAVALLWLATALSIVTGWGYAMALKPDHQGKP